MKHELRAFLFCIALVVAPLLCMVGERVAGTWGKVGLPAALVAAAAVYAGPGEPQTPAKRLPEVHKESPARESQ